jgi:hypothetical protein
MRLVNTPANHNAGKHEKVGTRSDNVDSVEMQTLRPTKTKRNKNSPAVELVNRDIYTEDYMNTNLMMTTETPLNFAKAEDRDTITTRQPWRQNSQKRRELVPQIVEDVLGESSETSQIKAFVKKGKGIRDVSNSSIEAGSPQHRLGECVIAKELPVSNYVPAPVIKYHVHSS